MRRVYADLTRGPVVSVVAVHIRDSERQLAHGGRDTESLNVLETGFALAPRGDWG